MKKCTQNKKIAFGLWFILSVLFIGAPTPFMFLLPGIFIVDMINMTHSFGANVTVILFGSLLNLILYLWVADLFDKKFFAQKVCTHCIKACKRVCRSKETVEAVKTADIETKE